MANRQGREYSLQKRSGGLYKPDNLRPPEGVQYSYPVCNDIEKGYSRTSRFAIKLIKVFLNSLQTNF